MLKTILLNYKMTELGIIDVKATAPSIKLTQPDQQKPVNSGGGMELLMNSSRTPKRSNSEPTLNLSNLEKELNDLAGVSKPITPVSIPDNSSSKTLKLATDTARDAKTLKPPTMPMKFENVVLKQPHDGRPELSKAEMVEEKFAILRKLENLKKKGVRLSKSHDISSSLVEMKSEYKMLVEDRERNNSVKFQGKMLMAAITGIEFLNHRFDPFDFNIDGWGEQVNENIDDYDEIFGELHEKYKSKAKIAPELKLLFQLAGSAIMVHMTNTMFKSSLPGMDDIMRQNPVLMEQFTKAAVSSLGEENPNFQKFMGEMAPPSSAVPKPGAQTPSGGPSTREAPGVDMMDMLARPDSVMRPEMKGPKDVDSILAGLKKKSSFANNTEPSRTPRRESRVPEDASTVSIQDLKDIASARLPAKSSTQSKPGKSASISLDL